MHATWHCNGLGKKENKNRFKFAEVGAFGVGPFSLFDLEQTTTAFANAGIHLPEKVGPTSATPWERWLILQQFL
jgi:hypothetical protein